MTKRKTVIVDIDGTVSDSRHRLHFVLQKPKDRESFHALHRQDAAIHAVVETVKALAYDHNIVMLTDRPDCYRDSTQDQLDDFGIMYDELHMRSTGDTTPAPEYKASVLAKLRAKGHNIFLAIDDQQNVADMWRANGIHCLQTQAV